MPCRGEVVMKHNRLSVSTLSCL